MPEEDKKADRLPDSRFQPRPSIANQIWLATFIIVLLALAVETHTFH